MSRWAKFLCLVLSSACIRAEKAPLCVKATDADKFDCYPEAGASKKACEARGCCWETSFIARVPWCYYPENYGGYEVINKTETETGASVFYNRTFPSPYPRDVAVVHLEATYETERRLRVKVSDARTRRYESPYPKMRKRATGVANPSYSFETHPRSFGFKVVRNDGDVVFESQSGFVFADQFLQIGSTFEGVIYGLGEHRTKLWLDTAWDKYTLFAHDSPPRDGVNLYGSHPFYLVMQPSGKSYGVFLHNSNAMDVVVQPLPAVTFRAIGGVLDFYFFMGPTPADVVRQYTELIGRSFMPPYWSLGFHLCKCGYGSEETTRKIWKRNRDAGIPFDVMWNDIDYMSRQNDFTVDDVNFASLPKLVDDVHAAGMRYVPILDPGVSASEPAGTYPPFDDGVAMDVFVKDANDEIFIGKVWNPNSTAFPDFTNPRALRYWTKQIRRLRGIIKFDGLWIDMNEPANFLDGGFDGCPESELEEPPYLPGVEGSVLRKKTLCMTAKHYAGLHYDVHNLYGISEHDVTYNALKEITGKRVFTLSRSTFAGSGRYGAHWSGDVYSSWHDLTKSIPEILSSSLFGMSMTGADICGFNGNATESLCNRWMQLGAFYPFSRNHNSVDAIHQDPAAFGEEVIRSSKKALTIRYTLLPYLYTLFYRSHVYGDTVARPLFFEFPEDRDTHKVDRSFLWGSGLYVVPVTEDYSTHVATYLPKGKWYDWYTGAATISEGRHVVLDAPIDTIPLLVRGGVILPTQSPAQTTTLSRRNKFTFMAFADEFGRAEGSLFWDDGESLDVIEDGNYGLLEFKLVEGNFTSKVIRWNTPELPVLGSVIVVGGGLSDDVGNVTLNGEPVAYRFEAGVLNVTNIDVYLNENLMITWTTWKTRRSRSSESLRSL